jgi:hypothetical protein
LDRPIFFGHLTCDGINADGGYVLASREDGFSSAHDLSETISAAEIVTAFAINSEFSLGLP